MRGLRLRFTARRLMVAVAAVAVLLAVVSATVRLAGELRYSTSKGWNTSLLPVGQQVVPVHDVRVGGSILPAGTRCVVVSDPPDEDSAYPDRPIGVKVIEGQHRGATVEIERADPRAR